jgi:hypothetical protein
MSTDPSLDCDIKRPAELVIKTSPSSAVLTLLEITDGLSPAETAIDTPATVNDPVD